jgi:tetratricopeptide (TPR) repeat protein
VGNLDAARSNISQAKTVGAPVEVLAHLTGMLSLAQKKYLAAIPLFEQAIKISKTAELYVLLGRAQIGAHQIDEAYNTIHKSLDIDNGYPEALLELSLIAIRDGEYHIAINRLKETLTKINQRSRPDNMKAKTYAVIGRAYLKQGNTGKAMLNLQNAIDLVPNAGYPHYVMGRTYDRLDSPRRSVGYYIKAIQYDPTLIDSYARLGRAYAKLGDKAHAVKYFQKYLNRNPPATKAKRVKQELRTLQQSG